LFGLMSTINFGRRKGVTRYITRSITQTCPFLDQHADHAKSSSPMDRRIAPLLNSFMKSSHRIGSIFRASCQTDVLAAPGFY